MFNRAKSLLDAKFKGLYVSKFSYYVNILPISYTFHIYVKTFEDMETFKDLKTIKSLETIEDLEVMEPWGNLRLCVTILG